jgi:N,N'-diacetyllegionaminate synthase
MIKSTLIIAEAGVNHNGDISLAKHLVDVAAEAEADFIKFQTFRASELVTPLANKAEYQAKSNNGVESQYEMLRHLELSAEMHETLIKHCHIRGIGFLSTGFDISSVDYLRGLGQERFKIPSGEITNLPYLRHIGGFNSDILLSTGMASLGDIEAAIEVLESAGTSRSRITVLHCTTEYPTSMNEVNLSAMQNIGHAFGVAIGYSDHTLGIEVPVAAVALGATVIEKHFTLSRSLPGPDHKASLEPVELRAMIASIRNIELALGDGVKRLTPSEIKNRPVARKSLVASKAIKAGEILCGENMSAKRPGTGISPMRWDEVMGRRAQRDFALNELIDI